MTAAGPRSSAARRLTVAAVAEALTWLALIGASIAKRAFGIPGLVPIVGPVHGVVFLAYFAVVFLVRDELGWRLGRTLLVLGAAVVPFGGFVVERRLLALEQEGAPAVGGT